MKKTLRERLDLNKVSRYAIAANAAQVIFAVGLVLYALFGREFDLSGMAERLLICAVAFVVVWGALLDIRDARNARKIASQSEMLETPIRSWRTSTARCAPSAMISRTTCKWSSA